MNTPGPSTLAPSFADFQFKTIGKPAADGNEPSLLRRMNPESIRNTNLGSVASHSSPAASAGNDDSSMRSPSSSGSSPSPTFSPDFATFYAQFRSHHSRLSYILSSHTSTFASSVAEFSQSTHMAHEAAQVARDTSAKCALVLEQCLITCQSAAQAAEDAQKRCSDAQDKMKLALDAHSKDELFVALVKENLESFNHLIHTRQGHEKRWMKKLQEQERKRKEEEEQRRRAELLEQMARFEAALSEIKNQLQGGEGAPQEPPALRQRPAGLNSQAQDETMVDAPRPLQVKDRGKEVTSRPERPTQQRAAERPDQNHTQPRNEEAAKKQQLEAHANELKEREMKLRQLALEQRRNADLQSGRSSQHTSASPASANARAPTGSDSRISSNRPSPASEHTNQEKEAKAVAVNQGKPVKREQPTTPIIPSLPTQVMMDLGSDSSESSQISRGNLPLAHPSSWTGNKAISGTNVYPSMLKEQFGTRSGQPLPKPASSQVPIVTGDKPSTSTLPSPRKSNLPPKPPPPAASHPLPAPQQATLATKISQPTNVQSLESRSSKVISPPRPSVNVRPAMPEQTQSSQTVTRPDANPRPAQAPPTRERAPTQTTQDIIGRHASNPANHASTQPRNDSLARVSARDDSGWGDPWPQSGPSRWGWGGASPMGPDDERRQEIQTDHSEKQNLSTEPLARRGYDHYSPEPDRPEPRRRSPSPPVYGAYGKRSREDYDDEYPPRRRHKSPEDTSYRESRRWSPPSGRSLLGRIDDGGSWGDSGNYRRSWSPQTPPRPYDPPSSPSPPPHGVSGRTMLERMSVSSQHPANVPTAPRGKRGGRGTGPPRGGYKVPLANRIATVSLQDRMSRN